MADQKNTALEITKIILGFISENIVYLSIVVLLIIYRHAISGYISRLIGLSYKNGDSELAMNAVAPIIGSDEKIAKLAISYENQTVLDEGAEIEEKTKEESWFSEMYTAFESGDLDAAETVFRKYALGEEDKVKLQESEAFYLLLRFEKGKDNSAIEKLEVLARAAKTEEIKLKIFEFISLCLSDGMQYKKEVQLWENAVAQLESEPLTTMAIVHLANALNKENNSDKAREILIHRLLKVKDEDQKANIYDALSKTEESLGNKTLSIYSKDKSLEFDPNNRTELFNAAYAASKAKIDEISFSNYLRLIKIDRDNPSALNNLGVRAQDAGLKIIAVENYRSAASHGHTLAMANQGYLFLSAGFIEEAEKIANDALKLEDPHENVYSLITTINQKKKEEAEKWAKISEKSFNRQKLIRCYTEKYYLGNPKELEGEWFVQGEIQTNISISNRKLEATWDDPVTGGSKYSVALTGIVSGASFSGQYTKKIYKESQKGLLGLNLDTSHECIGFVSDDGVSLTLMSTEASNVFSLNLSRVKTE
jgi:tetratricopeptide (TPR) repeat protein